MQLKFLLSSFLFITLSYATVSDGPYIGAELGGSNQNVNFLPSSFNLNTNGSNLDNPHWGMMARLNLGYNLDQYSGFEFGTSYTLPISHQFPDSSGNTNLSVTSLDWSYILSIPTIVDGWSVFGRAGFSYNWLNGGNGCGCENNNLNGYGFADVLGAGLKYNISPNTSFRMEWLANGLFFPIGVGKNSNLVANVDSQNFLAGINYHF